MSLYSDRLYIGMIMARSSALSINVLLIFDMRDLNGLIFLNVSFLFLLLTGLVPSTFIIPLRTIYASLQSQKLDLSIRGVNLFFLTEYRRNIYL